MGSDDRWVALRLEDVDAIRFRGRDLLWRPLRSALDTRLVGMSAYTAERAGQEIVEPHRESEDGRGHEEIYVVMAGAAVFTLDGERIEAPAGTFVRVADPNVHREAVAGEPGTVVLALGGDPAFVPAVSEWLDRARACLPADPERAGNILNDMPHDLPGAEVGRRYGAAMLAAAQGHEASARSALGEALALSSDPERLRALLQHDPLLAAMVDA